MNYLEWEILCDWRYMLSHPECLVHEPGPGFEGWELATVWVVFVVAAYAIDRVRK